MTEHEDRLLAKYWKDKKEESPDGWEKEHAGIWHRYYLARLAFQMVEAYDES